MENDPTFSGAGVTAVLILRYAIIIVLAVALFRLLMKRVRAATRNAVLGGLVIFLVFAGVALYLCGDTFSKADAAGLLVLAGVMLSQVIQTTKRFRAGKTFR